MKDKGVLLPDTPVKAEADWNKYKKNYNITGKHEYFFNVLSTLLEATKVSHREYVATLTQFQSYPEQRREKC